MGILIFLVLAGALFGALLLWARPGGKAGLLLLGALLAAGAGYALQGSPDLRGSPTAPRANHPAADPLFAEERAVWLGKVGPDAALLDSADNFIRQGSPDYAVGILRGAIGRAPGDMDLWIGLGNALATYADGQVTPAARYAFLRAAAIAPRHPAPLYFMGLAYASSGDVDAAERIWRGLLAQTPPDAPYRKLIALRLDMLAQLRAMTQAQGR